MAAIYSTRALTLLCAWGVMAFGPARRFVEAVESYATLGEICNTLRGVFGEYRR